MTSKRNNRSDVSDVLSTMQEPDAPEFPPSDAGTERNEAQKGEDSEEPKSDERMIACKVNTPNAIINGKRHNVGDEIEGGMTANDIRKHRRQGVAITCDEQV